MWQMREVHIYIYTILDTVAESRQARGLLDTCGRGGGGMLQPCCWTGSGSITFSTLRIRGTCVWTAKVFTKRVRRREPAFMLPLLLLRAWHGSSSECLLG